MNLPQQFGSVFLLLISISGFFVGVHCGKILANIPSVELSDYRFGLGDPYVTLYERENYRGKVHFQRLSRKCSNLAEPYVNWASSIDLQRRCVKLCDQKDCQGQCVMAVPDQPPLSERGVARLEGMGMNDKVVSIKFCY